MQELLATEIGGFHVQTLLVSLGVLVGGTLVSLILRGILTRIGRRRQQRGTPSGGESPSGSELTVSAPDGDPFLVDAARHFVAPSLILASVYGAVAVLGLQDRSAEIAQSIVAALFALVSIRFVVAIVNRSFTRYITVHGVESSTRIRPVRSVAVIAVWLVGLLFLLANLGFNISAVVAGLGIGGIAIALAAQTVLGDLFAYFVILFDRPVELGDFIIFGDILGTVERIGVKTTKIRSLSGEQVIISNSDLTNTRVRNYKRMQERRVVFSVDVVYDTSAETAEGIPAVLRQAVEKQDNVRFDRAHFASFAEWSLRFEVVYYVLSPDYNMYMDTQQRINLEILRQFNEKGIDFAFPTRTVEIAGSDAATD